MAQDPQFLYTTIAICCWPEHQSLLPTSCSGSWTLQCKLWAARRSTTTAWHTCFTLSCVGSMWQIESHTSLGWRYTSACMARHRIICLSCAHRSLKLLNDNIFVPPAAIYSLFHGFSSIRTAVAPSLDQRHGTCSKTICVSRTCKLTVFVVHWRRVFLISTRHIERIRGAFCDTALHKLTFTFTLRQWLKNKTSVAQSRYELQRYLLSVPAALSIESTSSASTVYPSDVITLANSSCVIRPSPSLSNWANCTCSSGKKIDNHTR